MDPRSALASIGRKFSLSLALLSASDRPPPLFSVLIYNLPQMIRFLFCICVLSTSLITLTHAAESTDLQKLASLKQWRHLLHYHQVGLFAFDESQADDPDFFLAETGKTDPLAELQASLKALSKTNPDYLDRRCQFPARYHWLSTHIKTLNFDIAHCSELNQWLEEIGGDGLTLIFPAAYLNSPSSMFGHTLMRVDSDKNTNPLLNYSINYAANADPADNELVFSYKGLTGGYPGIFSVLPYYQKVKEYSYLESRDVWEYELDIKKDELEQFLRHVWEIKNTHFYYYFFTENCSYHLLTLLDAASPRFNASEAFTSDVIPADTVRVLNEQGLIQRALFRPSMRTNMEYQLEQVNDRQKHYALALSDLEISVESVNQTFTEMSPEQRAQGAELAASYVHYLARKNETLSRAYNRRAIKILSYRSSLGLQEVFDKTPAPEIRDDEGHRSHRVALSAGEDIAGTYMAANLRMAYHDFLDPIGGYLKGAQLEMFNLWFRAYSDSVTLFQARFIDIASFTPRNDFSAPTSWFVSTGLERHISQYDELMPYLRAGPGLSYLWFEDSFPIQFTTLLSTQAYLDSDISKGYYLGSGPRISLLSQHLFGNINIDWTKHYDVSGAKFESELISIGASISLGRNWQIRADMDYQESLTANQKTLYQTDSSISLMYYF